MIMDEMIWKDCAAAVSETVKNANENITLED